MILIIIRWVIRKSLAEVDTPCQKLPAQIEGPRWIQDGFLDPDFESICLFPFYSSIFESIGLFLFHSSRFWKYLSISFLFFHILRVFVYFFFILPYMKIYVYFFFILPDFESNSLFLLFSSVFKSIRPFLLYSSIFERNCVLLFENVLLGGNSPSHSVNQNNNQTLNHTEYVIQNRKCLLFLFHFN